MKLRIKSVIWNIMKEKQAIRITRRKRIQKNEDSIRSFWGNFKRFNIDIISMPKGKGKEQQIGNLFEKIVKENFHNLAKEIDIKSRKQRESQRR